MLYEVITVATLGQQGHKVTAYESAATDHTDCFNCIERHARSVFHKGLHSIEGVLGCLRPGRGSVWIRVFVFAGGRLRLGARYHAQAILQGFGLPTKSAAVEHGIGHHSYNFV